MARSTGPKCKLCRAKREKLFLKGNKCLSDKCPIEKRPYPPGQHGRGFRSKLSNYGVQLREKQKVKKQYGLLEKQFKMYFVEADRIKGVTGTNLLRLLEMRIDNVVYRLGFALSRSHARQLVRHNFFRVNGKKASIPSFLIKEKDVIEVNAKEKCQQRIRENLELTGSRAVPEWLSLDKESLKGVFNRLPERDEMDQSIHEQLIVELYSK